MPDNGKVWARFLSRYGARSDYECRNRVASCRIGVSGSDVTYFAEGGPIPRAECVAAVNAFREAEYEKFLQWAKTRDYVNVSEYPAPTPIV